MAWRGSSTAWHGSSKRSLVIATVIVSMTTNQLIACTCRTAHASLDEVEVERMQQLQGAAAPGEPGGAGGYGGKRRGQFKKHKAGTGISTVPLFDIQRAKKKRAMAEASKKRKVQAD